MQIQDARNPAEIQAAGQLFGAYAEELAVDLCFQGFQQEIAALPGKYAPPDGSLLLATEDGQPVGCVALRPLADGIAEIKRLYVRPSCRGRGIGRQLSVAICDRARDLGYRLVRLDTLRRLQPAVRLYESLGFVEIDAYYDNPLDGVVYMQKSL